MPVVDGIDVLRILRPESDVPILMVTARVQEEDLLLGLDLGADDYIRKPYSPRELAARVRTTLRRHRPPEPTEQVVVVGDLEMDSTRAEARVGRAVVDLTPREFAILEQLASHPGKAFSRAELLDGAFGFDHSAVARTVDTHVMNLRRKLAEAGNGAEYVRTVRGRGYRLDAP